MKITEFYDVCNLKKTLHQSQAVRSDRAVGCRLHCVPNLQKCQEHTWCHSGPYPIIIDCAAHPIYCRL